MVKICPKCGTENDDEIFWCEKCNATLLENRSLILNKKITKNPYEVIAPKQNSLKKETEENFEIGECEFTYKKEKINIKPAIALITFVLMVAIIISTAFNIFSDVVNENIEIEGSWQVKSLKVDGQDLSSLASDSITMTFNPDGTYHIKGKVSSSKPAATAQSSDKTKSLEDKTKKSNAAENANDKQDYETTLTDDKYDDSDFEDTNQIKEEPDEIYEEDSTFEITGTWELNDGKLYIQPATTSEEEEKEQEALIKNLPKETPVTYECFQQDDCIILNIKSTTGATSLVLQKAQ